MIKKILLIAVVLIGSTKVYGASYDTQFEDWRSTASFATVFTNTLIATGTIYVDMITVTSGSVSDSQLILWDSTSTHFGASRSTFSAVYDLKTSGVSYNVKKTFFKGFGINKTGLSSIDIKWQYPYSVPVGNEKLGY